MQHLVRPGRMRLDPGLGQGRINVHPNVCKCVQIQGEAGGWLQESCVRTGDAFLLVFSVTDRGSFSRLAPALRRLRADSPRPDPPIILVANKSDLARAREVSLEGKPGPPLPAPPPPPCRG